ncbi:MobA/MobL family protein (plasmid) [Acinetobacter sp. ANC 7201]|uniref:MobA/MobL family protein n=1 Tax=Acinetobacter TaxID=469 RepID=UPI0027A25FE6|nr:MULTISPECIES: MobA/MobL family protein [Acinetobacter]MDY6458079.1 MobA/MobL family protein [Acinetobacter faecalis]WFP98131.1 MobA/MobL family protein [Acinetobacter sp. ANC 7201]
MGRMYYFDYAYTGKGTIQTTNKSGKTSVKKAPSCKNRFHYITRTAHYSKHKENEVVEYVKSGNLPSFAQRRPDLFWQAAHDHERKNARTAASQVIALPKELSVRQRVELAEALVKQFTDEFKFPYTFAIHNHKGEIGAQDQPHLHIMYCERSVDEHSRTAEQFFKRYNHAEPDKGGAQKITPDVRGKGKTIINDMRVDTEIIINQFLTLYAPTKIIQMKGVEIEVPNQVSCLHHEDYNRLHGTHLKAVPMIPKSLLRLDPDLTFDDEEKNKSHQEKLVQRQRMIDEVNELREYNNFELYQAYYYAELEKKKKAESQLAHSTHREVTENSTSLTRHLKYINAYADDVILWSTKQDQAWAKQDYKQAVLYMSNKYSPLDMSLAKQSLGQLKQTAILVDNDKNLLDRLKNAGFGRITTSVMTMVNNAKTSIESKIERIQNTILEEPQQNKSQQGHEHEKNDPSPGPDC